MKSVYLSFALLLTLLLPAAHAFAQSAEKGGIQWISFEEAIKRNAKHPKKIVIDVFTDWCGWCKVMDRETFVDPTVVAYVNANYYAVKLNAERTDVVTFKGKDYKFIVTEPARNKGYHELASTLLGGKLSYPTLVFMDENMNLIQAIPGFRKAPEMDMILKYFGGDHYKNQEYSDFTKNYVSPYQGQ